MLILSRRVGESIVIGNDIIVTINDVCGNHVKVAVKAPKEVSVHREEVYRRIQREKALSKAS